LKSLSLFENVGNSLLSSPTVVDERIEHDVVVAVGQPEIESRIDSQLHTSIDLPRRGLEPRIEVKSLVIRVIPMDEKTTAQINVESLVR
jgi:hypothetical protein